MHPQQLHPSLYFQYMSNMAAWVHFNKLVTDTHKQWAAALDQITPRLMPSLPREEITLKDGTSPVWLQPLKPGQGKELVAFYQNLSRKTLTERFHGAVPPDHVLEKLGKELDESKSPVIAVRDATGNIIALSQIFPLKSDARKAEIDITVAPDYQGNQLSKYLINACFRLCAKMGFNEVTAETEPRKAPA